ncbi:MAG: hypothetical protein AAGD06_30025, partial [Acidobacteriota bacterium]
MTPQLAFFQYEVRRHLPAFVIASLCLLGLPIALALKGSWRYWEGPSGDFLTTLVPYLLTPWVGGWIAAHGWAEDRSQKTLEWLQTRPLSTFQLFGLRLLAVVIPVAAWLFLAYLTMLPLLQNGNDHRGIIYNLALLLALSVGFGSFFSALLERPAKALVFSVFSTYCFHYFYIAIFLRKLSGPIRWDLWVNLSETSLLLISMAVEIV